MSNTHASSPQEAADVLRHVESVGRHTSQLLRAFWFPLVVFGALTLASAPVQWWWPGGAVGAFWAIGGPLGGALVGWYYRNRERRLGLHHSATAYVLTAVGMLAGAFLLPAVTSGDLREVASVFAVAAGYLVFAWLDRSPGLAALAVSLAVVPVVVLMSGVAHPGAVTAVVTGTAILASGLVYRRNS